MQALSPPLSYNLGAHRLCCGLRRQHPSVVSKSSRPRASGIVDPGLSAPPGIPDKPVQGRPASFRPKVSSSWDAKEANGGRGGGADYLYEVGQSDASTNVDVGQSAAHGVDYLFTGNVLGHKSDIADGSLRQSEFRTFNNIVGDYYVSPRFLEEIALHVVKNYMVEMGWLDQSVRVPLILGVWGAKGMGKTFQTELAFKKLGLEAIIMSAGELEHEWAGTPGRLIRERYRRASMLSKVRGKFSCLMINDIDAGIGHRANTQITVNNQIVVGTLMNLCDHPTTVSIGQDWMADEVLRRTPIIVTGNDFSTLFAPLVRDGRMTKFYWNPDRSELVPMLWQMYRDDGLTEQDMHALLDRFKDQPLDFFGALRSSTYDGQIRKWIETDVVGSRITWDNANMQELGRRLLKREGLPVFQPVQLVLSDLIKEGERLEYEQQMVDKTRLSQDYYKPTAKNMRSLIGLSG